MDERSKVIFCTGPLSMKRVKLATVLVISLVTSAVSAESETSSQLEDLMALPLEQLIKVEVEAASILPSSTLLAASTVDYIPRNLWQSYSARRTLDALSHLSSTLVLPITLGSNTISTRGYTSSTSRWGMSLIWDDAPLNDFYLGSGLSSAANISLGTLNHIEFIRGPGSAMHGSDAFHGVVALRSYDPPRDSTQVHADLGSNEFFNISMRHHSKLSEKHSLSAAMATSGQANQHSHFQYSDPMTAELRSSERANEYHNNTLTLQLHSKGMAEDSWYSRVGLYSHHYEAEGFPGIGTEFSGINDLSSSNNHLQMIQISTGWDLAKGDSIEFKSYGWKSRNEPFVNLLTENGIVMQGGPIDQSRFGFQGLYKGQLIADRNTRWALALGADKIQITDILTDIYDSKGSLLSRSEHPAQNAERTILYTTFEAHTSWDNDRWHFIYGARHDNYSDVKHHTSPRLGIIHQPAPDTAIKLLYSNAFRAPNAAELYGSPNALEANKNLNPETLDSLELVWLKQNEDWLYQLILFKSLWKEGIIAISSSSVETPFRLVNAQRNESQGFSWKVKRDWQNIALGVSGSYVTSEETDSGHDYAMFPSWIFDMELAWQLPQWNTQLFVQQRFLLDMVDVDSTSVQFDASDLPTYSRTDISAVKKINKQISLKLSIRNLFDRENILPAVTRSKGGLPDEGFSLLTGIQIDLM